MELRAQRTKWFPGLTQPWMRRRCHPPSRHQAPIPWPPQGSICPSGLACLWAGRGSQESPCLHQLGAEAQRLWGSPLPLGLALCLPSSVSSLASLPPVFPPSLPESTWRSESPLFLPVTPRLEAWRWVESICHQPPAPRQRQAHWVPGPPGSADPSLSPGRLAPAEDRVNEPSKRQPEPRFFFLPLPA